jgi:hypothetical protein
MGTAWVFPGALSRCVTGISPWTSTWTRASFFVVNTATADRGALPFGFRVTVTGVARIPAGAAALAAVKAMAIAAARTADRALGEVIVDSLILISIFIIG